MKVRAHPSDRAGRASPQAPLRGLDRTATIPCALNVSGGLYIDEDGSVYPVTNWFDEDGDECPRDNAVACVAGHGACWFSLVIADFDEGQRYV